MKDDDGVLVLDVDIPRMVVAIVVIGLVLFLPVSQLSGRDESAAGTARAEAAQAVAATGALRYYYLTKYSAYDGSEAATACAAGYHFASLWELLDPSNLRYNTAHPDAYVQPSWDQGSGPPVGYGDLAIGAWIRTGYASDVGTTPGHANCAAWSSNASGDFGTLISLQQDWSLTPQMVVWNAGAYPCIASNHVWCIED